MEISNNSNNKANIKKLNNKKFEKNKNNNIDHNNKKKLKKIEVEEISYNLIFQNSEESFHSKKESKEEKDYHDNIIIGEIESDINMPVFLNIDPETKFMMNNFQIYLKKC